MPIQTGQTQNMIEVLLSYELHGAMYTRARQHNISKSLYNTLQKFGGFIRCLYFAVPLQHTGYNIVMLWLLNNFVTH